MREWPDHYPAQCPPNNASEASNIVYRFTNRTPKAQDFRSYYEMQKADSCIARGLTVYMNEEDCLAAAAIVPALQKKHMASATLPPNTSVVAPTESGNTQNHHTLWSTLSPEKLASLFSLVPRKDLNHD